MILSYSYLTMLEKKNLLGVGITSATKEEILEYILQSLKKREEEYYIATPNPELLVLAHKNPQFQSILNQARLALCDGTGVFLAGKLLGQNFKQRITGVDFLESLCKKVSKQPITVGFLGGRGKIAELAAECLVQKYPGLKVVFAAPEWPQKLEDREWKTEDSNLKMENKQSLSLRDGRLNYTQSSTFKIPSSIFYHPSSKIDILFVAFGSPKQEEWISKHIGKVPVRVMMGVGGGFDFISGKVARAPRLVRRFGLEWLYRLIRQPWRIKRQLALLEFVALILKTALFRYSNKY